MPTESEVRSWNGRDLIGSDGSKIGTIEACYADDRTGEPMWALVHSGLFGRRSSFVPITDAQAQGDDVRVPLTKGEVQGAPGLEGDDEHLGPDDEDALYRYYGRGAGDAAAGAPADDDAQPVGRPDTGAPQESRGPDPALAVSDRDDAHAGPGSDGPLDTRASREAGRTGDPTTHEPARPADAPAGGARQDGVVLSEEQLRAGTVQRPATRMRMRKYTVTEEVTVTVPVSREEVRLEEVPLDETEPPEGVVDLPAGETEVVLHEEVPVVQKETVARERVRLDKDVVHEEAQVTEQVRREVVDVEHADRGPARGA